jgi:hypothetical protein
MVRADWMKRRLQLVEADLYRTLLAESSGSSLAAALLSDSPAAKLLARTQRQIAAFERTWHRANTEFHRTRADDAPQDLDASPQSSDPLELASFPQSPNYDQSSPEIPLAINPESGHSCL